jgi:TatA/E family protein of Tat protein translocase
MGSLSVWHVVLIVFALVLLFGPGRISRLGKDLGESISAFRGGLKGDANPPPSKEHT